jgi:Spy/CpxP family protein refolding chaperone
MRWDIPNRHAAAVIAELAALDTALCCAASMETSLPAPLADQSLNICSEQRRSLELACFGLC